MIYTLNEYTHLEHHGIEDQRWGHRNGPPYPLEPDQMTSAQQRANANEGWFKRKKREAAEKKEAERQAKIAEKERKVKAKKLKKNLARAARKYGLNQEKKNEIIRKGDVAKAHKYKDAFSQKEIADLLERKRLNDMLDMEVSKISQRQKEDGIRKFETMGRYLNTVVGVGKAGVDLYNIYAGVSNALMGTNKSLISLNPGDRNKDKNNKDKNNKDKNNNDHNNKSNGKNQPASIIYNGSVDRRSQFINNGNLWQNIDGNGKYKNGKDNRNNNSKSSPVYNQNPSYDFGNHTDNSIHTDNSRHQSQTLNYTDKKSTTNNNQKLNFNYTDSSDNSSWTFNNDNRTKNTVNMANFFSNTKAKKSYDSGKSWMNGGKSSNNDGWSPANNPSLRSLFDKSTTDLATTSKNEMMAAKDWFYDYETGKKVYFY